MTLSINSPANTQITISSTLLNSFIASPASYTDVKVQMYFNSTSASTTETYTSTRLITSSTPVSTSAGLEYINTSFLNTSVFAQGVYHIVVTLTSSSEILTDEGCLFVEDDIACDVNTYRLLSTVDLNKRLNAGLDYYMLTKSQDCSCGCDNLIEIYNNLVTTLANNTCSTC
jgi:hypothetical protein